MLKRRLDVQQLVQPSMGPQQCSPAFDPWHSDVLRFRHQLADNSACSRVSREVSPDHVQRLELECAGRSELQAGVV